MCQSQVASLFNREGMSVECIVMPFLCIELEKSRSAPLGRRRLTAATQELIENSRLSVEVEDHTDPSDVD
jgi:hypothetical protein